MIQKLFLVDKTSLVSFSQCFSTLNTELLLLQHVTVVFNCFIGHHHQAVWFHLLCNPPSICSYSQQLGFSFISSLEWINLSFYYLHSHYCSPGYKSTGRVHVKSLARVKKPAISSSTEPVLLIVESNQEDQVCFSQEISASCSSAPPCPSCLWKYLPKGFPRYSPKELRLGLSVCFLKSSFLCFFGRWVWCLPSSSHHNLSRSDNTVLQW